MRPLVLDTKPFDELVQIVSLNLGLFRDSLAQSIGDNTHKHGRCSPWTSPFVEQLLDLIHGNAARKGLQRRDIILTANYRPVASAAALEAIVREAESSNREAVLLRVQRRSAPAQYVAVRIQR